MRNLDLSKVIAEMDRLNYYMYISDMMRITIYVAYNSLYLQQYSQYRHMWE